MNNEKLNHVLDHINRSLAGPPKETQHLYCEWSECFDEDMNGLGYAALAELRNIAMKHLKNTDVVLDVGGGTGNVGEVLRQQNFCGTIDVLDANVKMLLLGEKKGLSFRTIIRHTLDEDGILPLKDGMYDAVISIGSFLPSHIPATALKGIIKVIKKDGKLIVSTRGMDTDPYRIKFDKSIHELVEDGKIKVVETKTFQRFSNVIEENTTTLFILKVL